MKLLLTLFCLSIPFQAQADSHSPWWNFWQAADQASGVSERLFNEQERSILRGFLASQGVDTGDYDDDDRGHKGQGKKNNKKKSLPPGLQKKLARGGELPPGWQKKVARGEVMDGELYASSVNLPRRVLDRLPQGPSGTSIRQIDDRVVRIMDATGVILDVLTNSR